MRPAATPFLPIRPRSRVFRYVRLVRFSFLILIGHFVTLEGMKIQSVTPVHHQMIMVSSARCGPGRRGA
jgi:hypothetical protein